ncbi:hypothetical protein ACFYYR_10035 [Streptomyces sp. NPDC001922]|uniref:hypothetical protein n=1 Tax=Streptomyces sp. NPDC001922 TaxID=3364624 RepID=UPI0036A4A723
MSSLVGGAAVNSAFAIDDIERGAGGSDDPVGGGADGENLMASVSHSKIVIKGAGGEQSKVRTGALASVDPNWVPPACWYEPVFSPKQLKSAVESGRGGYVNAHEWWSNGIFVDHYDKGEPDEDLNVNTGRRSTAKGYKNYNVGKDGMFWRSVVAKGHDFDRKAWDCGRIMFWQDAGTVPDDKHAPTPEVLASYAYDKIRVPDTEVELNPKARSTVNLPTWAWLDKGKFKDVKVRAELPGTGLWAETTAKPVGLHLEPGTKDAELHPGSGECAINGDGSIGTPYTKGQGSKTPPCGITYLRATSGKPYAMKASVTWEVSWEGSGGAKGDLPNGTFETTQDVNVQELQAVDR